MKLTEEQLQAHELFLKNNMVDPFPEVKHALLNWADVKKYVEKVGMICPFEYQRLRPASYPLRLLGSCIYYDEKGKKWDYEIDKGDILEVKSNSIVFLTLEPLIQLPDYIAARFNLRIDLVYKGCLLGTGPLVDPGFVGRLSFPLHNLTTNDFYLEGGSSLIWMEFTKLSPHDVFRGEEEYPEDIPDVPYRKDPRDVWDYMCEAHKELKSVSQKGSIRSSIPKAMANAEKSAREAEKSAKEASENVQQVTRYSIVAVIALVIAAAWFFFDIRTSIRNSELIQSEMLDKATEQNTELRQAVSSTRAELDSLKQTVTAIIK